MSERDAGFEIRPATGADEEAMVDLELESAIHHAAVDPQRWRVPPRDAIAAFRRRRREAEPGGAALLAVAPDGRVVGMVEMLPRGFVSDPGQARIPTPSVDLGVSVGEDWRGRGVGTALMRAAEEWARAHGAERIVLDLAASNTGALRLYERLGYETHGLLMDRRLDASSPSAQPDVGDRLPSDMSGAAGSDVGREGAELPTLRGEHVVVRPIREADRDALLAALSAPSVVEFWDTRGPQVSTSELLAGEPGWHVFAIEVDGEFAGSIQASEEEDDPDYRHAAIDVFLSPRFQGRGLGTDAVRTVARWLVRVRGHHRLTIDPAASNERAIRTYAKVGFKPVGVMREYERGRDGRFHDGLLMDLLARELT